MTRILIYLALAGLLTAGAIAGVEHIYDNGVAAEKLRRDGVDAQVDKQLKEALQAENTKVRGLQDALNKSTAEVAAQKKEVSDAKNASAALQSDLAAGRQRLSVLTRVAASQAAAIGSGGSAAAGAVDPQRPVTVDLDGRVAADLEWLRQTRNDALFGLSACITSYNAVKVAQDGARNR